jgi:hypothetical protein
MVVLVKPRTLVSVTLTLRRHAFKYTTFEQNKAKISKYSH